MAGVVRIRSRLRALLALVAALCACGGLVAAGPAAAAPTIGWELLETRPHDPEAFTQGLVAFGSVLLESTGDCCPPLSGRSSLRRVDPRTGSVLAIRRIPAPVFAEGATVLRGTAWQLTWYDGKAFAVSPITLRQRATVRYRWEGWGLTTQGSLLVASNGGTRLRWLRPPGLSVARAVEVQDEGQPLAMLNELEMLDGVIWANIWPSDRIALIDPATGRVRAWLDMSPLRRRVAPTAQVLNGIARDPVTGHVVVTGKLWDRMFVIRLTEPVPPATR